MLKVYKVRPSGRQRCVNATEEGILQRGEDFIVKVKDRTTIEFKRPSMFWVGKTYHLSGTNGKQVAFGGTFDLDTGDYELVSETEDGAVFKKIWP